jgi:hypothetical protein
MPHHAHTLTLDCARSRLALPWAGQEGCCARQALPHAHLEPVWLRAQLCGLRGQLGFVQRSLPGAVTRSNRHSGAQGQ